SFNMNYIDWEHPENNVYHVTDEFQVERENGRDHIYPDIVLFINGIPAGVIENKRPSVHVIQAVSQMIRNQKQDYAPQVIKYIQLVMATTIHEAQYATCGTPARFWAVWREENMEWLGRILNVAISKREVTKQDQDIASLFHPDRL